MDPFVIIKALNVAVLLVVGGALYIISCSAERTPWLRHWAIYEFALAAAVIVDGYMLPVSLALGVAVPVLLLGILGYRKKQTPPRYAFVLLFLVIALPAYGLAEVFSKTYGFVYLGLAVSAAYLGAAALFFNEGGTLNRFIAAVFVARIANSMLYSLWESMEIVYVYYGSDQILALMAGVGMLMAGFERAYNAVKKHEQELILAYNALQEHEQELMLAYNQSEELTLRLERRNEEYLQARLHAEAANTAKSQFLANMSHELRTPLNAILGFSEVLAVLPKDKVLDKVGDYGRNIHEAASGLQAIINDILNLSRVEAGALEITPETCDLSATFADILRLLQPLADQKEIRLDNRADETCPARCDARLVKQALINGISNAIKYTQRGGRVVCSVHSEDGYAVATVEDDGIGIEDESLLKAFDPFWQEGNNFLAENNGVGLGLTIAKSYIEAQGGRIELTRAKERGTIFRIYLPTAEAEAPRPPAKGSSLAS